MSNLFQDKTTGKLVRWLNIVLPAVVMLLIWLVVGIRRHARKEQFLASVGD